MTIRELPHGPTSSALVRPIPQESYNALRPLAAPSPRRDRAHLRALPESSAHALAPATVLMPCDPNVDRSRPAKSVIKDALERAALGRRA
jgi:hypothetical protein